ncbi:hypothetical protein [Gracilimonas sediminicola]|uniref:hypothetical protein n=1 Tax=Gracilimonas sediminicola TaxID=2952158 RepID=UPI0038D3DB93
MLSLDSLLIPVLGGFLFIKYFYFTRFRAIRDNGYVILFKSSIVGLSFYAIALFLLRIIEIDEEINPKITNSINWANDFLVNPELLPIIISLLLMALSVFALNWILDEDEMKKRVINQDDDSLEVTILKGYEEEKSLLVTLDNGKVYVGKVTDTYFRINDEIRSILLNPLASGFRESDTQKINLNTYYGYIYEQIIDNPEMFDVRISDFSVAIRYDHIVSVSPFDLKVYAQFKELDDQTS